MSCNFDVELSYVITDKDINLYLFFGAVCKKIFGTVSYKTLILLYNSSIYCNFCVTYYFYVKYLIILLMCVSWNYTDFRRKFADDSTKEKYKLWKNIILNSKNLFECVNLGHKFTKE